MVDATGPIVWEAKVASAPEAFVGFLTRLGLPLIVLRLFLPGTWINDPERLQHAGKPEAFWGTGSKPAIALAELEHPLQAGVSFGAVVSVAGYGISAPFRQGLSALGLLWAVGIPRARA